MYHPFFSNLAVSYLLNIFLYAFYYHCFDFDAFFLFLLLGFYLLVILDAEHHLNVFRSFRPILDTNHIVIVVRKSSLRRDET